MARGRGRGGHRQPANPAAVSGPSALSQRTDGGPGSDKQPLRVASGGDYGDRQAMESQQQAAPLPAQGARLGGRERGAPQQQPQPVDLFAPTGQPGEPITAGATGGPGVGNTHVLPPDPDEALAALYEEYRHPDLFALLERRQPAVPPSRREAYVAPPPPPPREAMLPGPAEPMPGAEAGGGEVAPQPPAPQAEPPAEPGAMPEGDVAPPRPSDPTEPEAL